MSVTRVRVERVTETIEYELEEDTQVRPRGFADALRNPASKLRRALDAHNSSLASAAKAVR